MEHMEGLLLTINKQQHSIQILNQQLAKHAHLQNKYKKALKDILGVIKANKQLKQQLDTFNQSKQHHTQIQQQQFHKAYQKLLNQKNQLLIANKNLIFEQDKLKYSIESLEQYVSQLKAQPINLSMEKQLLNNNEHNRERSNNEKHQIALFKEKQNQYHKTLQSYQQHHVNLNTKNRHLEETITQLQIQINKNNQIWKNNISHKQIQIIQLKTQINQQFQSKIQNLKKQNFSLKNQVNDLLFKIETLEINNCSNSTSINQKIIKQQYEEEMLETLKQLKQQMQPMKLEITQLQNINQFEKNQNIIQKTNLKMKVIQLQSDLNHINNSYKLLQHKLIQYNQKERNYQNQQLLIKKLQQQNRILGGRVIVLQAKDITLKNRNDKHLQQRTFQFQSRVQLLLNNKQIIFDIKKVSINQLISLKSYIIELDAKLKQVVSQNQYSSNKYKSYKQKCQKLTKDIKQKQIILNGYKNKIDQYDQLIVKLQTQLEKITTLYQKEVNSFNCKIQSNQTISNQIHKKRYQTLNQKLQIQKKYHKQQLQTLKLNYQTKLMEANIKISQIKDLKSTIQLFKLKNQQLSKKLTEKQNKILQIMIQQSKQQNKTQNGMNFESAKQIIQQLQQKIKFQQQINKKIQLELKNVQYQWQNKYKALQELYQKQKKDTIIQKYQIKVRQLQEQIKYYQNLLNNDDRFQFILNKLDTLQINLQEANNTIVQNQAQKCWFQKALKQMNLQNQNLTNLLYLKQNSSQNKKNQINLIQKDIQSQQFFNILKQQAERLKKQVASIKNELIHRQFQRNQIEQKMNFFNKSHNTEIKKYQQQIQRLEYEIKKYRLRQQELNIQFSQNHHSDYKIQQNKKKIKNYQQQINTLNKIVIQLQKQIEKLRVTFNYDSITSDNETIILRSDELQALQKRMKNKEREINQVKKSLIEINFLQNAKQASSEVVFFQFGQQNRQNNTNNIVKTPYGRIQNIPQGMEIKQKDKIQNQRNKIKNHIAFKPNIINQQYLYKSQLQLNSLSPKIIIDSKSLAHKASPNSHLNYQHQYNKTMNTNGPSKNILMPYNNKVISSNLSLNRHIDSNLLSLKKVVSNQQILKKNNESNCSDYLGSNNLYHIPFNQEIKPFSSQAYNYNISSQKSHFINNGIMPIVSQSQFVWRP